MRVGSDLHTLLRKQLFQPDLCDLQSNMDVYEFIVKPPRGARSHHAGWSEVQPDSLPVCQSVNQLDG